MMRRVYYLLCEKWALSDLEHRRLKVARFNDLNDPFELLGPELPEQRYRQRFYRWRAKVTSRFGLLCFSKTWRNPVLWSHYGDRHKGLCLGFDIPANELHDVRYLGERSKPTELLPEKAEPGPLFLIKFKDWAYENESRRIIRLAEARKDGEHYFWPFGEDLALREIIVGARCKVTQKSLQRILKGELKNIKLTRARRAFKTFNVVTNLQGWNTQQSRDVTAALSANMPETLAPPGISVGRGGEDR